MDGQAHHHLLRKRQEERRRDENHRYCRLEPEAEHHRELSRGAYRKHLPRSERPVAGTDGGRSCRLGAGSADAGEHAAALAEPDAAGVCQRRRGRWHGQCPLAGGFGSRLVHEQPHSLDRGSDSYRQPDQPRDLRGAAEGGLRPAAGVSGAGDGRERWEQRGGACRRRPRPLRRRAGAGQGRAGRLRLGPPL